MIKQNLIECNRRAMSADKVTAKAGLIFFDGLIKAMKIQQIITKQFQINV